MATLASGKLSDILEDFLKTVTDRSGNPVYREKISQLVSSEGKSLTVDFGDLLKYNSDVASKLLLDPDTSLASFKVAAFETLRSENALYADRIKRELIVRIRGIPDLVPLRKVDTSYLDRMLAVSGMVVRTSELRPMMTSAAWVCPSGHTTSEEQNDMMLKRPAQCEVCGETRNFELDKKHSRFIDFQILRVQELPEELPPGQLPQFFDVNAEGDIVNMARPGDRVVLSGIVRAVPDYTLGQVRTRLFRSQIDCNHIEVKGKEQEQIQVTKEDEAVIKSIAKGPDAFPKLVQSIAPVILGHDAEKEAILLLLAGGGATALPDGTKLRGDLNILFVGDPGCLVADERVALGNGAFAKIGEIGTTHLQDLKLQVLTGEGGGKRATATRYHVYRRQPILEVVTETGKSIKGTYNHPLLVIGNDDGRLVRTWKRLDELKVGDRVAAATYIPCPITKYQTTGFRVLQPGHGPRFHGRLPPVVNEDLGGYLGYILGDGFVDRYRAVATIAEPEIDLLPQLEGMVGRLFGLTPKVTRRVRADRSVPMTDLYVNSECIATNLSFLRERRVPDLVFASGNKVVSAFLKWLFEADGTVFSKGRGRWAVGLKAKDIELLRDVQVLLLRWGIHSRIEDNALLIRGGEDIVKYAKYIGFASRKKIAKLEHLSREAEGFGRVHGQRSERIVAISPRPPEDVYDIEVPRGHRFIANGLISHNTGKSEMLKFASQVATRGLYASGRGTTAAGLSAAVIREKNVLMLEAGVVVLADLGIACIDEFEKMKAEDRTALHEMMEQQSYHPSNEVMFLDGTKSRIGEFVECALRSDPGSVVQGVDCEILELRKTFRVHSVGVDNKLVEARVDRVSRHRAPGHFYSLAFSNGRKVVVTPEHPVFVFRNGAMRTTDASDVRVGDFVPAPASIPPTGETCELHQVPAAANAKPVLQQKSLTPSMGRVLGYLVTEGNFYRGRTTEVDFANYNQWRLNDMKRHAAPLFGFEPIPRVVDGKRVTLRYVSKVLYDYFKLNFPEMVRYSIEKRAPKHILAADAATIREFLAAAFLGDGSVEPDAVCYRTSSLGLAEDYQDLLLRIGVSSRLLKDRSNESYKVYVTGDSLPGFSELVVEREDPRYAGILALVRRGKKNLRHHDVFPTDVAREIIRIRDELGLSYDGRYWRNLREGSGVTRDTLEEELRVAEKRLGDLQRAVHNRTASLKAMRAECGWSQEHLARLAGATRRVVEYHERGGYQKAERARLENRFRAGASEALHAVESDINEIRKLMELRFLRVRSVERVENGGQWATDWVYDMTVEPTHNFVSDGLVLHNTVTIAKGGIYATLNARTAILAACNPILGRYNTFQNLTENIENLPVPLLTRFDLIFVIKDQPTPADDERLASHILSVHARRSYTSPPPIEFSLLKKYLAYAKRLSPTLTQEAMERIKDYYMELRRSSAEGQIPPTPRTLEALIRIATARARVLLRDEVKEEDAFEAISLMRKMVEDVLTDASTKKADFGIQFGKPAGETKNLRAAMELFRKLEGADKNPVERGVLKEALVKANFSEDDAEKMIRTMFREGIVYESKPGFIRRLRD